MNGYREDHERFTAVEGAYSGTSDDVLGRWYIVDREADTIDKRGRGYATKAEALTAAAFNLAEDERITAAVRDRYPTLLDGVAPHIPGTDYYDGRDGSIEAEDDDEDRIADQDRLCVVCGGRDLLNDDTPPLCEACDDAARREEMHELVEWQRGLTDW